MYTLYSEVNIRADSYTWFICFCRVVWKTIQHKIIVVNHIYVVSQVLFLFWLLWNFIELFFSVTASLVIWLSVAHRPQEGFSQTGIRFLTGKHFKSDIFMTHFTHSHTRTHTLTLTHTHTHTCWFLWFTGTFHRRNGFYTVQAVCAIALHLNLALTGDGAFLFSLKKTHSVWFISVLNYGDTENVLINHLLLVIPMSYPWHYTNVCPHKPHKHAHTHTHTDTHTHRHTRTHTHIYIWLGLKFMFSKSSPSGPQIPPWTFWWVIGASIGVNTWINKTLQKR